MVKASTVAAFLIGGVTFLGAGILLIRRAFAMPDIVTQNFYWTIGTPSGDITWAPSYMEQAYAVLKTQLGLDLASPAWWNGLPDPRQVPIAVEDSGNCPGVISGYAGGMPPSMGFCSGDWNEGAYQHWILAHELTNLMTGVCVSYNWPTSYWANSASPFPILASLECMRTLGFVSDANFMLSVLGGERCFDMFDALQRDFGWGLYRNLFQMLRADQVRFLPSTVDYVVADYLQRAAAQDLSSYFALCPNVPTPYPPYP